MPKINDLIEWDFAGSHFSLYIKHFLNEEGEKGCTMIFEDQTHDKVTEIVVPPQKYRKFIAQVTDGYTPPGGFY